MKSGQWIGLKWSVLPAVKIEGLPIFDFPLYYHNSRIVQMWADTNERWELIYENS